LPQRTISVRRSKSAFGDAHAGAVEQLRQQAVLAFQQRQHAPHLIRKQHHRQTRLALRPADGLHPRQIEPEHLLIEKQQRRQCLPVCGHGHVALVGQPRQEGLDLLAARLAWVAPIMKTDKRANPVEVRFFGAQAVVQVADALSHLIQQPCRLQRRPHR
jgi:hypothetical protein